MIFKRIFIALVLLFSLSAKLLAQKSNRLLLAEGNAFFEEKKYAEAISRYSEALENMPKDFDALFNMGNALYRSQKYGEADAMYSKAFSVAKNKKDAAMAQYNLGNSLFKNGKIEDAIQAYQKSLKQNPDSQEALKNLQIAKKKLQENKQNKSENDKNNQNSQKESNNQDKDQNGKDKLEKDGKNPQNGGNNDINEGDGKGNGREDNSKTTPEKTVPKGVRDQIMNNLSEREKETARRILNKPSYSQPQSKEKDW